MATLTADIGPNDTELRVTGDVSSVVPGIRFRLDDELLDLAGFDVYPLVGGYRVSGLDHSRWFVNRGVGGSVHEAHTAGTVLKASVSASISSGDLVPPDPFAGAGVASPAAFVEPTTATPEAIAQALIDASLMEPS